MGKYNTLGSRIKELRQSLSLSQADLAQQLHCTQAALSQYESGNREPGLQELVKIASTLNTSTDYLLGITHIKNVDADIKLIGDYLGFTEESIETLHNFYWEHKQSISDDYLQNEVKQHSGAIPGDENYEQDLEYVSKYMHANLNEYVKFINEFICSPAFRILSTCLRNNLFIERTIYDLFRVAARQYDEIESSLFESNIAAKAYVLTEESEDFIKEYSLNIFDAQTAVLDFCKKFTNLEIVKELEYKESFYKKLHYLIYHYTRPMFKSGNFSFEELDEALSKDEFKIKSKIVDLLENYKK